MAEAAAQPASTGTTELPGLVRSFVAYFTRYIEENNVSEIHSIYENSFSKLTERFYKKEPWPHVTAVASLLGSQRLPPILYKELYYRHTFSRLTPTLMDRIESWNNYVDLFSWLLDQPTSFRLPHSWLFDLIDEFVWQAQSFNHYRNKVKALSGQDKALLAKSPGVWSVQAVLRTLEKLVDMSKIRAFLKSNTLPRAEAALIHYDGDSAQNDFLALGYFSLIGLLRLHCMMGDYHTALVQTQDFKLLQKSGANDEISFGSAITPCDITLYYYTGFCSLMLKRYEYVTEVFAKILLFLASTKQRSAYQFELISKKQDQMLSLLAIAICMSPSASKYLDVGQLDEILREKHAESLVRLRRGDSATYEELFSQACPKFISASNPPLETSNNVHLEPLRYQQSLFLVEVKQQSRIPIIRSYLKLYSSIGMAKLASFLHCSEEELRSQLLSYKHRTSSDGASGDISFYVDCDMIHVIEAKPTVSYVEPMLSSIRAVAIRK